MIKIGDKSRCCGCAACVQSCPQQCINLIVDKEGFLYPKRDITLCIDCGKCEKVCPEVEQNEVFSKMRIYAAVNPKEEIRRKSSSGGVFTLLAEIIITEGGVVFGARFDKDWSVIHDYTETHEGLEFFRGSKYVQSKIGNTYRQAELFLKAGRKVMFTGTPCQIAGLKKYLRKNYGNLLAVDFVCHGVPSLLAWEKYLEETLALSCDKNSVSPTLNLPLSERDGIYQKGKMKINAVSFRNKNLGWKKFSVALTLSKVTAAGEENTVLLSSTFNENVYMQAFLSDLSLRPSCYNCPAKGGRSGSDITFGDFWGIEEVLPEIDDDKGVSLVIINTKHGNKYFENLDIKYIEATYDAAIKQNKCIADSVSIPVNRDFFFFALERYGFYKAWEKASSTKTIHKIMRILFRYHYNRISQ